MAEKDALKNQNACKRWRNAPEIREVETAAAAHRCGPSPPQRAPPVPRGRAGAAGCRRCVCD